LKGSNARTGPGESLSSDDKQLLVLRKGVVCFLHYLADLVFIILHVLYDDVQVQACRLLFSIAVNGILIVFLVYLPVVLAMRVAPTIFPISVTDPFTEILVAMLLLQIYLPYAVELRETFEALLHQWVTAVCCVLGFSCLLCSRPENIGGQENVKVERRQDRLSDGLIAAQDPNKNILTSQNIDGVEKCASDTIIGRPVGRPSICYTIVLRAVLLVVLAWITFLLFSLSLIIVSIPLGRVLFSSVSNHHGIKCNDLYTFFIENLSIWTSFTGARFLIKHFKAGKAHSLYSVICQAICIIAKSCVLLSLWIIVIPVLIGLLFELSFMVPIRALEVEVPVLLLFQNWAVGFVFFKLWRTLGSPVLLNHRIVLVDESWRIKFERVRDNDFLKLPGEWMLQEILIPIVVNLLMSSLLNSTVYQFTWVAYLTIIVLFSCAKRFPAWITNLHNSIRDDRYFGLGLQNYGEAVMECENEIGKLVRWLSQSEGR
ncbi:hypothetical protein MKW94_002393, partial [Papaver nudicaule]|nr:hypothetical protein [Papaver nudicaule]